MANVLVSDSLHSADGLIDNTKKPPVGCCYLRKEKDDRFPECDSDAKILVCLKCFLFICKRHCHSHLQSCGFPIFANTDAEFTLL